MWEILLNSVLNGWLKWAVLLTNCKWAVVNSIRIKKWLYILTNRKWAISSLPHTCGPTKLTRPLKKEVDAYARLCQQHTVLAAVVVGCPSNGCRASSSISDILASPAQKMIPPPDI